VRTPGQRTAFSKGPALDVSFAYCVARFSSGPGSVYKLNRDHTDRPGGKKPSNQSLLGLHGLAG
jgi:hypothetical protein